jgi:hypothetical protein
MITHPVHDLIIGSRAGARYGYVVYTNAESPLGVSVKKSEVNTAVTEAPGQSGGVYSVRDQDQPAFCISDWSQGAGQKSYEVEGSVTSKFHSSSCIDTAQKGELRLARVATSVANTLSDGIMLSALGYIWRTDKPAESDPRNSLKGSIDGTTWQSVPYDGVDPEESISCLATDGEYIYAAFPTGGIYRVKDSDGDNDLTDETMAQWDDEQGIVKLCFSGGYMYGAKSTSVGYFTAAPAWDQISPAGLAPSLTTFGLVPSNNWAYWGMTSQGVSRVARVQYDGTNEWYEDVCEFPSGFVGTCMASYLGNVYVGGYYECSTSSVGQGAIYLISSDTATLLTTIGDNPDYAIDPSDISNDNRVWSLSPYGKDLYILTTRKVLRWDLDDGGWVHVMDVAQGTSSSLTWITTDDVDYAGTAAPASGTWTATGTGSVSNSGGELIIATKTGNYRTYTATLAGDDALDNSVGTTMQVKVDGIVGSAGEFGFDDGTREARVRIWRSGLSDYPVWNVSLGEYYDSAWHYTEGYYYSTLDVATPLVIRLTCKGTAAFASGAKLYVNGTLVNSLPSGLLKTSAAANTVYFGGGWDDSTVGGIIHYDYVYISDDGAYPAGAEYAPSTLGSITAMDNVIYCGINGVGHVKSASTYATSGWLRLSTSAAKSGSLEKTYHAIIVDHEPLRNTESITCSWYIDGVYSGGDAGTTSSSRTIFAVNQSGHNISPVITLATSDGITTPIVRGITVTFSFARYRVHSYVLDCRAGAEGGAWRYDPELAVEHLFTVAEDGGFFEDRFAGSYLGAVETCELIQAERSERGTIEGLVQLVVKELG